MYFMVASVNIIPVVVADVVEISHILEPGKGSILLQDSVLMQLLPDYRLTHTLLKVVVVVGAVDLPVTIFLSCPLRLVSVVNSINADRVIKLQIVFKQPSQEKVGSPLAGRNKEGEGALLSFWQGKVYSYLNNLGADLRQLRIRLIRNE